jgi:hypothetical protein
VNRRNVNAGIWLIGLGILFLFNFFWPGILILAGLSMIATALIPPDKKEMPSAPPPAGDVIDVKPESKPESSHEEPLPAVLAEEANRFYNQSLLPDACPACGGPVKQNAEKVVWKNSDTAACPFCEAVLKIPGPPAA